MKANLRSRTSERQAVVEPLEEKKPKEGGTAGCNCDNLQGWHSVDNKSCRYYFGFDKQPPQMSLLSQLAPKKASDSADVFKEGEDRLKRARCHCLGIPSVEHRVGDQGCYLAPDSPSGMLFDKKEAKVEVDNPMVGFPIVPIPIPISNEVALRSSGTKDKPCLCAGLGYKEHLCGDLGCIFMEDGITLKNSRIIKEEAERHTSLTEDELALMSGFNKAIIARPDLFNKMMDGDMKMTRMVAKRVVDELHIMGWIIEKEKLFE